MAKTRAQRKAEKRRREQQLQREQQAGGGGGERDQESRAQHDTQAPVSGDVAETEAVMRTGAHPEDYGEQTVEHDAPGGEQARAAVPGVTPEPVAPEQVPDEAPQPPAAPAPSRADVGAPDAPPQEPGETREQRRARKKQEKEQRKQEREREIQKVQKATEKPEKEKKRRSGVFAFFASCWAELKKVQWPDRDTLVQASAVTIIFVAIAAAYLGVLDAAFNWLIKQII
jgi:preprotein translocase subunit SecE